MTHVPDRPADSIAAVAGKTACMVDSILEDVLPAATEPGDVAILGAFTALRHSETKDLHFQARLLTLMSAKSVAQRPPTSARLKLQPGHERCRGLTAAVALAGSGGTTRVWG